MMCRYTYDVSHTEIRVGAHGRVVIPSEMRRALGVSEGSTLIATLEDGRLVLEDPQSAAKRWRGAWKRLLPADADPVRALLEERAAEAALDDAEAAGDPARIRKAREAIAGSGPRRRGRERG
jgi:AbrB family looped-hinge helix DNA binding protein